MTRSEFMKLPLLLPERTVLQVTSVTEATLVKWVACGVLEVVKPVGCGQAKYQRRQVAILLGWPMEPAKDPELLAFAREHNLMGRKAVMRYTGYCRSTMTNLARKNAAGYLRLVGTKDGKWQKAVVAKLVGWEELV